MDASMMKFIFIVVFFCTTLGKSKEQRNKIFSQRSKLNTLTISPVAEVNEANKLATTSALTPATTPDGPYAVTDLKVSDIKENFISLVNVTFKNPRVATCAIDHFVITYEPLNNTESSTTCQSIKPYENITGITVQFEHKTTFSQLIPVTADTQYRLTVKAFNGYGNSIHTINFTERAKASDQVTKFNVTGVTSSSAQVQWSPPRYPKGNILAYEVRVKNNNKSCTVKLMCSGRRENYVQPSPECQLFSVKGTADTITENQVLYRLDSLTPYTDYSVDVLVINSYGKGCNSTKHFRTSESAPESVQSLMVSAVNDKSSQAKVTFNCPHTSNGKITYYWIMYEALNNTETTNQCQTIHPTENKTGKKVQAEESHPCSYSVLVPVTANTLYLFKVFAMNMYNGSSANNTYVAKASVSDPVTDLEVTSVTSTNATVHWSPPTHSRGNILAYEVRLRSNERFCRIRLTCIRNNNNDNEMSSECEMFRKNTEVTFTDNQVTYELKSLTPYTDYSVDILVINSYGKSDNTSKRFKTSESVPGEPNDFRATANSSSKITLFWSPSIHKAGPTSYVIDVSGKVDQRTNNCQDKQTLYVIGYLTSSAVVTSLCSYTNYTCTIMASTSAGNSSCVTLNKAVRTGTDAADPPLRLKVENVTASSVSLSWMPSRHQCGLTNYIVDVEEQSHLQSEVYVLNRTITVQGFQSNTVDIASLTSYWRYRFSVRARTSVQPDSKPVIAKKQTLQSPPGRVKNLQVSALRNNYTAVKLTWECPEERDRHGPISNYTVQYSGKVKTVGNFPNGDPCTEPHTAVLSVQPDKSYNFTVFATAQFEGSKSITPTFDAKEGKPGKVENLTVTPINENYTAATVSFSTPKNPNGVITHYMLSYFILSARHSNPACEVLTQITNNTGIKIEADSNYNGQYSMAVEVSPETRYSFQVTAFNSLNGEPAEVKYTTGSNVSGPIRELQIHNVTSDSVLVTWKPPAQPNGFLMGYRLKLNRLQPDIDDECYKAVELSCSGQAISDVPTEAWCDRERIIDATLNVTDPLSYQLTGLRPDTEFGLFVIAVNKNGSSIKSVVRQLHTNESAPAPVTSMNFSTVPGDYSSLILHFTCLGPDATHGNVTHYTIKYTTVNETMKSKCGMSQVIQNTAGLTVVNDVSCNFSKRVAVTPEREYNFTIQAFNTLPGKIAAFQTFTPFGSPGPVKLLKIRSQTNSSATIQWETPQQVNGMIHSYQLTVELKGECIFRYFTDCGDFNPEHRKSEKGSGYTGITPTINKITNNKDLHYITVHDLLSYTDYTVSVVPINGHGSGPEERVHFMTDVGVPTEPRDFHASVNNSTTITLFWSPSEHQAGPTNYSISLYGNVDQMTNSCIYVNTCSIEGFHTSSKVATNLCSYTYYNFTIMASTSAGNSAFVYLDQTYQTRASAADPPQSLKVENVTASSVSLSWMPSRHQCGLTDYIVDVEEQSHLQSEVYLPYRTITVHGFHNNAVDIANLTSYWNYKFSVRANTSVGPSSSSVNDQKQTLQSSPGRVKNIQVSALSDNYTAVKLTWECPEERERHGPISSFTVQYSSIHYSIEKNFTSDQFPDGAPCKKHQRELHSAVLPVHPEQKYQFKVFASAKYEGLKTAPVPFYAKAGKPPKENSTKIFLITPSVTSETTTESTFPVTVNTDLLRDSTNGRIVMIGLLVMKDTAIVDVPENLTSSSLMNWRGWKEWKKDYKGTYRPTPDNWLIPQIRRKRSTDSASNSTTRFIVGNDNCESKEHCNGPVEADTSYRVIAVSCTNVGCSSSTPFGPFRTKAKSVAAAAVGSVLAALVVVGIVIGGLVYRRQRNRKRHHHGDDPNKQEEGESVNKTRPKKLSDFSPLVDEYHKDSGRLFAEEWREIGLYSPSHPYENATLEVNREKNRYTNILAYDQTRVKLLPKTEDDGSDYINANFILGFSRPREYIASQGPVPGTLEDFWQMIWEQNVPIIVQLTDLYEGGRRKLSRYWPEEVNVPETFGEVQVETVSLSPMNKYTIKVFNVSVGSKSRQVKHFFLQGWQDYNANLKTGDVIDFARYVRNELKPTDKGPMVVHCSAGVGRTGTFICVDYFLQVINKADLEDSIDIFSFVLKMRDCRPLMVQSESQYVFVHDAVKEMIERKKKALAGVDEVLYENQAFDPEDDEEDNIYENT